MKILIDDEKVTLPDGSTPDVILRNYGVATAWMLNYWLLESYNEYRGRDELYLDHDLGDNLIQNTGYKLICMVEEAVVDWEMTLPKKIVCVSNNPSGRLRIQQVIDKLYGRL